MSRIPSTFQNMNTSALSDPRTLDAYTRQTFGMSAQQMDVALKTMMAVSQGRMPEPAGIKFVIESAKMKYGWNESRTRAELKQVLEAGSPQQRIHAYMTGNGTSQANPQEYAMATELVQNGLRADVEGSLLNRLADGNGNNKPRDEFSGMQASARVLDDARDKASMRSTLERLSGHKPAQSYEDRVHRVLKARNELADRVEAKALSEAAGHEPSLRESLADSYDLAAVTSASEDIGLGNPIEEANESHEANNGHFAEDYDVTAGLRD